VNEKLAQLDAARDGGAVFGDNAWMLVSAALCCTDRAGAGAVLRRAGAAEEYVGHHDAELRIDGADHGPMGAGGYSCASREAGQ